MNILEYDNGAKRISTSGPIKDGQCISKERAKLRKIIGLYNTGHWQSDLYLFLPGDDLSKMRRYYFGVVIATIQKELVRTTGDFHDTDEIDDYLRKRFFFAEIASPETGEVIKLRRSIADKSQTPGIDFWDGLIEKSRKFALDFFGVIIPDPNCIV